MTVHYLTSEWTLEETVLSTDASEERHAAVNIANCIREVTDKFGLGSKVVVCVHDNTANVMRAGSMEEEDGWKNIGCATLCFSSLSTWASRMFCPYRRHWRLLDV